MRRYLSVNPWQHVNNAQMSSAHHAAPTVSLSWSIRLLGEPELRLAPRRVKGKQVKSCSCSHCRIYEGREEDGAGVH